MALPGLGQAGYVGFSAPAALSRDPRVQLLGLLRRFGTLTRADLAEHMGVSTTMIGEWIADLVHARLIEEASKAKSRGGRPAQRVTLAGAAAVSDDEPPTSIGNIVRVAELVIHQSGVSKDQVRAVGVALAGFVDTRL